MKNITFENLDLHEDLVRALAEAGYESPTAIQRNAIPEATAGSDLLASAQTGTGKTAAFALPMLNYLCNYQANKQNKKAPVRGLVLTPTRELALQIEENIRIYSKHLPLRVLSVVGGHPIQKQVNSLRRGVDIVIATPGRLIDLLKRNAIRLNKVDVFVLDEADRMLDMGFVFEVKDIARELPSDRQTMLFSATLNDQVHQLARVLLKNPKKIDVHPESTVAENIEQQVFFVDRINKLKLIEEMLQSEKFERTLVFTTTKANANVLANRLSKQGVTAAAIHSDKNQKERQAALKDFDSGKVRILVATDVVARGIDIDGITHVINFDLPTDAESYVHRIGRTARAGASGVAISLCDMDEVAMLKSIERLTENTLDPQLEHRYHSPLVQTLKGRRESPFATRKRGRR